MKKAIIILNRLNISGFDSKTRIGRAVHSQSEANLLSEFLLEILINNIKEFEGDIFICYPKTSILDQVYEIEIAGRTIECLQQINEGSILTHISDVIKTIQKRNYNQIVCTVSDAPYLDQNFFLLMFESMKKYDVVISPAMDGGINAYAVHNDSRVDWIYSENEVSRTKNYHLLNDIEENLKSLSINYFILGKKYSDIDTLEDIKEFYDYIMNKNNTNSYNVALVNLIEKWIKFKG